MRLTPSITLLPILHGRQVFADEVRRQSMARRYDCIAVDLPDLFQADLAAAVDQLPVIHAVTAACFDGPVYYVPCDPCDAMIEAVRQSRQVHVPCAFIGSPRLHKPLPLPPFPDDHAATSVGFDAFCALCLTALGRTTADDDAETDARHLACRLHELEQGRRSVLAVVHLRRFMAVIDHFRRKESCNIAAAAQQSCDVRSFPVNPDHLYFALGELPFTAGRIEKARHDLFAANPGRLDMVKEMFRETRDEYYNGTEQVIDLSPARMQVAMTFLRNLTVMGGMLAPSLFDIVAAAKGVGGDAFAVRMLACAKYYPYLPVETDGRMLSAGIDRIAFPGESATREAVNLFKDTAVVWKRLNIKHDPGLNRKKNYRYRWNPMGMCSHLPEDRRIETFNIHVRRKALRALSEDLTKTEKFTTSVKDGIDIRETLRNWFTGDLYVKELPPSRGDMDTVVIIFDEDHDERYPHRATMYAEHDQESTLTFYATDPFEDLVGPGVARSRYGGLSLLFPPRPVPDIFTVTAGMTFRNAAQQLVYGALLFSREKVIAYVAPRKPHVTTRVLASKMKKRLVWIPLAGFSSETVRRLQRFHILNGHVVRSWASRFIGD